MSFTKFASAEVLEVKGSNSRLKEASLSKFSDYDDYRTDDGYLYVRVRAISSRVNLNRDGWPSAELQKSYRTFIGKPLFVDHHNHDPKRARGVVVDANIHVEDDIKKVSSLDPYYASAPEAHLPPTWVELLLEVDARSFPKLGKAIISDDIDGVSMGANVERSKCFHCGNWARSESEFCKHIISKGAHFDYIDPNTGHKTSKQSYEDCHDINFFELSFVFQPADETALFIPGSKRHASDETVEIKAARSKLAEEIQNEGYGAAEDMTQQMVSEARREFAQAMSEGADRTGAIRAALLGLKDMGASKEQATAVLSYALASPAELVAISKIASNANRRNADRRNPTPQDTMITAPNKVDTLRQEQLCPICASNMDDGSCAVCSYTEPPEGFDNPDLEKAQEIDLQQKQQQDAQASMPPDGPQSAMPGETPPMPPGSGMPTASHTTTSAGASTVITDNTKIAANDNLSGGKINSQERPILPATRKNTDKPLNPRVIKDYHRPVESWAQGDTMNKTAKHSCADCEDCVDDKHCSDCEHKESNTKVADGASAQGTGVAPDGRVNLMDAGGFLGDPESGTEHTNVEKEVHVTAPHTDTWGNGEGDSLGQHDPVTKKPFPNDDQGPILDAKTPYKSNVREAGPAFPDHDPKTVDLMAPIAEPVGPNTMTWSGDKGDSLGQENPVGGKDSNEIGGPMGTPLSKGSRAHLLLSMRIADVESEIGLINSDERWERGSELEDEEVNALEARLDTLSKLKMAGLLGGRPTKRVAATRSLPIGSMKRAASTRESAHEVTSSESMKDAGLFM